MTTRRSFIAGSAAAVGKSSACEAAEAPALPIPPLIDARRQGQAVSLTAQSGQMRFMPGAASATLGFNGAYLGPTVRVHSGDDVEFTVANRTAESTTVHWHGLLVPSQVDGGPHNHIGPGGAWRPVLPIRQPASTVWYHAHPHPNTASQVYRGLSGMLIVADAAEQALGLPSRYGIDDLPLILQDRRFDGGGRVFYPTDMPSLMTGVRGEVILVNGAVSPMARTPRGLVRLRLLNGSNARLYHLSFADNRLFHWIGTEGGLLERPVAMSRMTLAPGQRAEILVDFSDGRATDLLTGADDNMPMGRGMMAGRAPGAGMRGAQGARVMRFQPGGRAVTAQAIPKSLAQWSRPDPNRAVRRRKLALTMGGGMGMGARGGGRMGRGGPGMGRMAAHGIDGRSFDMDRIDQRVKLGDVEIWEVSGEMMQHPFHIHGVHFEVISRDGRAPSVTDQGRRDTVLVQEPVELLARFTQPAPNTPFMYHCHILEHEDHGMMGQYVTT